MATSDSLRRLVGTWVATTGRGPERGITRGSITEGTLAEGRLAITFTYDGGQGQLRAVELGDGLRFSGSWKDPVRGIEGTVDLMYARPKNGNTWHEFFGEWAGKGRGPEPIGGVWIMTLIEEGTAGPARGTPTPEGS